MKEFIKDQEQLSDFLIIKGADSFFIDNFHYHDFLNCISDKRKIIKVGFCEVLEGEFDPDNDIFIKNYAKLSIDGKKFIPSILPSGITNGEIGPITSTFTSGGEFNYNDVKAYNKIALAMKTNRENREDKFKSIINMGILG